MTILDAVHDPLLFRPLFKNLDTWQAWFVVLRSVFGLPMTAEDLLLFRELTGRDASAGAFDRRLIRLQSSRSFAPCSRRTEFKA